MKSEFPVFVTVILPVRNEMSYIKGALSAILSQDYSLDQIEILITDGMSTDCTRDLIKAIINELSVSSIPHPIYTIHSPPSIVILDNPKKIVPTGMNIALRHAKGQIIIRVDGHCIIAKDYVRKCVEHIQKDGVDGVGGPMETIAETFLAKAIAIGMSSPFGVGNSAFRTISGRSMLADTVPFPAYTRQIIERAGLYDEELVRNQDDEYNYRIRELGGKILLAEDVRSTYFSRTSLKGLWKQYFQYGYWKVRVLQKHPWQMSPRQFVPPAFVFALLASLAAALAVPWGIWLLALVAGSYVLANLSASILTSMKKGGRYLPLLPLIFAILHTSYGLGFLVGLVKFANRWGDRRGKVPAWEHQQNTA